MLMLVQCFLSSCLHMALSCRSAHCVELLLRFLKSNLCWRLERIVRASCMILLDSSLHKLYIASVQSM
jgi:hypothetical protein